LRRGHSIPDVPQARPFEGGYTDIFATGVIENVWHCDVTSLYPSVVLAFGYLPTTPLASSAIKGAAFKSRGMEPYLRDYLETFLRLLLKREPQKAAALRKDLTLKIRRRELSIDALAKTEALQASVASYLKNITASSRNRSAAFELAIKSGQNYQAGDQISYYITGASKNPFLPHIRQRLLAAQ